MAFPTNPVEGQLYTPGPSDETWEFDGTYWRRSSAIGDNVADAVLYSRAQSLTDGQKLQARTNIGASTGAVLYTEAQSLTAGQKTQARANIGAVSSRTAYVSTTGSDSAAGTRAAPLASLTAALALIENAGEIIMLGGDYETAANAMLNLASARTLTIRAEYGQRVRVFLGEKVTNFTQIPATSRWTATVASGYSMADRSITGGNDWLRWVFEMDTPEGIITEPLPQQRGRTHRLDHSRLWYHATTGAVESANARFTYSGTTLSISATDGGDPNGRDYWIPSQTSLRSFVFGGTSATDIEILGIEVYFGSTCFDFSGCYRFKTTGCVAFGAGGDFTDLDHPQGEGVGANNFIIGEVIGDEYVCCANDGFGPSGDSTFSTWSKLIVRDVHAHDNADSGLSAHYAIVMTVDGGLYENNCESGMTNALGVHFSAYSPHTRANGFNFTGIGGNTGSGGISAAVDPGVICAIHNPICEGDTVALTNTASGTAKTITGATQLSTTVTITTSGAHGYYTGQKVSIAGMATTGYNIEGATVLSTPSTTTFTYTTTGGLTSPGDATGGTATRVSVMNIYRPMIINPTVRAFQNASGCAINVFEPSLSGVTTIVSGEAAMFTISDKRRSFFAIQTGASYTVTGTPVIMEGWSDATGTYDRSGVFASNRWTPGKVGLCQMEMTLVSTTLLRTIIHLYKNGAAFAILFDGNASYKNGIPPFTFYNSLLADYYEIYIQPNGATINTSQNAGTNTTWSGRCLSEA